MTTATAPETVPQATPQPTAPVAPAATDTPTLSIIALVSSLSSILLGLFVPLSIVGIVLGVIGLQREPKGRTMAIWSIVVGAVPFAIGALVAMVGLAFAVPFGLTWVLGGF